MTMWTPDLGRFPGGPRYRAIVDALAADVEAGKLRPGDRLPTHRELASRLGVSLGTVTRAYLEAEERGLTSGEVGRGTFVRGERQGGTRGLLEVRDDGGLIDLSVLLPPRSAAELVSAGLKGVVGDLAGERDVMAILGYHPHGGAGRHREAGAAWLGRAGLSADPEEVLVCASGQHAAMVAVSALTRSGDTIFTEELTSPLLKDLAAWLELRLHGLPMDGEGLVAEAFRAACRTGAARVLYCMPTLQNPTTVTQSEARRREIAAIAEAHDVAIVEDGVLGLLAPGSPPPLSAFAPAHGCYFTSLSKTITPGVRVGYLRAPSRWRERFEFAIRASTWMASPLAAEIAARWIADGTADRIAAAHREEAAARQALAARLLEGLTFEAAPTGYHLWLHLPEPWRSSDFVACCRQRGVAVTSPEVFTPGRGSAPHAVRVCIGPVDRTVLERALRTLAEVLATAPPSAHSVV